jgi:hypothetical protein
MRPASRASRLRAVLGVKSRNELIYGDPGLLEHTTQSASLEFPMVGHNASHGPASHDGVATSLPSDDKTKPLKSADDIRTRDDR